MFVHIKYAKEILRPNRVILLSIDSNVVIMCPRYTVLLALDQSYCKTGTKQKRRYISINIVAENFGASCYLWCQP